jgi:pimeloyl-ACP methyl ester carboxylesterase
MTVRRAAEPWTPIPIPAQAIADEGFVDVGAAQLRHWDTGGNGEIVILNHGATQSALCWLYQQPALAAAGYRVIGWSRRGVERSSAGNEGTAANDLKALADALGVETCHLLGVAEGAAVAIHFALENPERTRSLILSGGRLFLEEEDYRAMNRRAWLPDDHGALPHFYEVGPAYRGGNGEGMRAWAGLSQQAHPAGISVTHEWNGQAWGAKPLTWARLSTLDKTVLMLTGDADHYCTASHNRLVAQYLTRCELGVIDEAGSAAYWEQPDAFNSALVDFLRRQCDGRSKPPLPHRASEASWTEPYSSVAPPPRITQSEMQVWNAVPVPAQVPAKEGYAETSPVRIWHWDTGGDGEAIVFCHPWSQSSECWKYQQPFFAERGYRVIGWSQRGFYKSEKGPEDDPGSSAGDLHQLMAYLDIDKFHIVGCAAGGCTAVAYAIAHPERLHSVTLSGSILLPDEPEFGAIMGNLAAARPGVKTNIPVDFREVGASYRAGNPEGYAAWQALEALAHPDGWYLTQPWGAERNWAAFANLDVPVLLQTGDTDMSGTSTLLRLYTQKFPNCELRVLREAGHAAYWEQPAAFNASVLEFIERNGRQRA